MHRMLAAMLVGLAVVPGAAAGQEPRGSEAQARPDQGALLARAATRAGQWDSAARLWRALTVANPLDAEAWAMLGEALVRLGAPADAVAALAQAARLQPGRPGVALSRGRAELALGDGPAAIAAFAAAVAEAPLDPRGWTGLGVARDLVGDHGGAREAYARALAIDPLNRAARHNMALSAALAAAGP